MEAVRSETETVWSSPAGSKYERVESGSLSPTEMPAETERRRRWRLGRRREEEARRRVEVERWVRKETVRIEVVKERTAAIVV